MLSSERSDASRAARPWLLTILVLGLLHCILNILLFLHRRSQCLIRKHCEYQAEILLITALLFVSQRDKLAF